MCVYIDLMERPPKSNNLDRLSNLPDSIFHHILSFLDIKQVARLSTLSRRCRKVCLSSPFLNIDLEVRDHKEFYKLSIFLQRFMFLRNGADMHQFKVGMRRRNRTDYDEEFQICNWVLEASRSNVEKIYLKLNQIEMLILPSGVLNCASLRCLEVDMAPGSLLKLPAASFGGLESMTLRHLSVSIALFGEWISSCKSLKMLYLDGVCGIHELNISSSSLERLILEDLVVGHGVNASFNIKVSAESLRFLLVDWWMVKNQRYSLTLHAPKLEQFHWHGYVSHYSYEGNFEFLSYSDISLLPCPIYKDEHGDLANEIIGKVLQTIYRVSSICIYDLCIKVICLHEFQPEFCNLRSFTLMRTNLGDSILPRVFLLNFMTHLNTLKIHWSDISKEKEEKICYNAEYWESHNLEFVHSLKEVEMEIRGKENEIELIKYFLNNAKALKKMTILYPSVLHTQSEISRKIQQFQIASSAIALYFIQK